MRRTGLVWEWVILRYPRLSHALAKAYFRLRHPFTRTWFELGAPELIALTQKVWKKRLKRPISEEEAREIVRNFRNLFLVLKEVKGAVKH